MPARITVSEITSDQATSILRVDSRPLTSSRLFASPHFVKHIDKVVAALGDACIAAEADPLTDTVQPGLG